MRKLFTLIIVAVFATAFLGCETQESSEKADESTSSESETQKAQADRADEPDEADEAPSADEDEAKTGDEVAMVDVPEDGKEFDPAVEKSRVPGETWICDMGTVHWASKEKPEDGKCPLCGMQLSEHTHAGDSPK